MGRIKISKKMAGYVADAATGILKGTDELKRLAQTNIETAMKKISGLSDTMISKLQVDQVLRKSDGVYVVFKKGGEIKLSKLNDLINGRVLDGILPNLSELFRKYGDTLDDASRNALKKLDDDLAESIKKTDAWKQSGEIAETGKRAKKLSDKVQIPKNATKAEISDALKKTGKMDEFADFAKKSSKRKKFGTFLKGTLAIGAIYGIGELIEAIERHRDNINGCWIVNVDDPTQAYKIKRKNEICESDYGCIAAKPYDSNISPTAVKEADGSLTADSFGFPGNILWSPCAPVL